ncbi:MAG: hypothetical protein ACP5HH_07340 [Fervidicoccaceae archaeon]
MENKELERIVKELEREIKEEERKRQEKEEKDGQKQYKYFSFKTKTRYLISFSYKDNIINYIKLEKVYIPNYPNVQKFKFEMIELKINVRQIKENDIAISFIGEIRAGKNDKKYSFEVKFADINTTIYVSSLPDFTSKLEIEKSIRSEGVEKTFKYIARSLKSYLTFGFPDV